MKRHPCSQRFFLGLLLLIFAGLAGIAAPQGSCQERPDSLGTDQAEEPAGDGAAEEKIPPGLRTYMGRRVATTMHYLGAEWLIRENREEQERCSLMLARLGIKPGMTIVDMGCGNGFYSLQMAKMVGPQGRVLGVDIQPKMLEFLRERMTAENVKNVEPILGTLIDPRLPAGKVDLILCVDVYHEFSHPVHMLKAMRESLAPEGRLVLVEYRGEDPRVPIKPLHKMTKKQINKEMNANGLKLVDEFDSLPWQHMMFFGADDE
ncbi:class I SAM-dependent methyltransferase [Lignipirellula cremea]|uniref:Demethylmenaquinone methyltransferase n=1 Tax=Lignipirellula cremea TaxID=2528010 RepID=A0A518DPL4_9BACT|nr:class I SAM-dependent methyltransferase [Lignipirellula cremea]QDU93778.1 Demethylmenaquinone methyltransferase [Lignipirellula cremea]